MDACLAGDLNRPDGGHWKRAANPQATKTAVVVRQMTGIGLARAVQ